MLVCQILDAQFVKPTFAVEVPSVTPKLVPKIVMNPPCDVGPFTGLTWVTTGELYEKALLLAPELPPTMTPAATCGPKPGATWHSSKDPETQAILEQLVAPIITVAEMSTAPKFLPDRVRLAPPLSGAFAGETDVMAGESYEKAWDKVPITSSSTLVFRAVPTPKLAVQTMDVAVSQRFDVHTVDPRRTLAPGAGPKLVPDSVILAVVAALRGGAPHACKHSHRGSVSMGMTGMEKVGEAGRACVHVPEDHGSVRDAVEYAQREGCDTVMLTGGVYAFL